MYGMLDILVHPFSTHRDKIFKNSTTFCEFIVFHIESQNINLEKYIRSGLYNYSTNEREGLVPSQPLLPPTRAHLLSRLTRLTSVPHVPVAVKQLGI